jgi:hypothetical protein
MLVLSEVVNDAGRPVWLADGSVASRDPRDR